MALILFKFFKNWQNSLWASKIVYSFFYYLKKLQPALVLVLGLQFFVYGQSDFKTSKKSLEFQRLKDGLSNNWVHSIIKDHQGYIWLGTHQGLNQYDGLDYKVFVHNPKVSSSLPSSVVNDIHEDYRKDLWFATGNGLARLNRESYQFDTWKNKTPNGNYIQCILEDKDHNLWLGTRNGLKLMDTQRAKVQDIDLKQYNPDCTNDFIRDLKEDDKGRIWIFGEGGVDIFDPQKKKLYKLKDTQGELITTGKVSRGIQDTKGDYWMLTVGNGLYRLKEQREGVFKLTKYLQTKEAKNYLLLSLLEDRQGNIWVGSENGGLYLFDPMDNKFFRYQRDPYNDNSLSNNSIWEIYQDNENRLWVAPYGQAVCVFDPLFRKFEHIKQMAGRGLSYNSVMAFLETKDQKLWAATDGGGITIWDRKNNSYSYFKYDPNDPNSLGSNAVIGLYQTRDGKIWATTWGGGLNLFDEKTQGFIKYKHDPNDPYSIPDDRVVDLDEDKYGNLWIGMYEGGVAYFDRSKGKFTIKISMDPNDPNSLISDKVFAVKIDSKGRVWTGARLGLSCITLSDDNSYSLERIMNPGKGKTPTSIDEIAFIYEDSKKRIWICAQDGLFLYQADTESFIVFDKNNGLKTSFVNAIIEDDFGDYWISTDKGLSKMSEKENGEFTFTHYKVSDGLQGDQYFRKSCFKNSSGEIFMGGNNGFNYFRPETININSNRPNVLLTNFKLFNKDVSIGTDGSPLPKHINELEQITLNYQQSVFSIEFIALNLTHSDENSYAYKLKGLEQEWNYVGNRHMATYTSLDAGEYIFLVKGTNNDGIWGKTKILKIIILPPWWETWTFRILVLVIFLGLIWGFYYSRTTQLKKRQKILEDKVAERTQDLLEKNETLNHLNQEIQTQAEELQQQTEELSTQRDYLEEANNNIRLKEQKLMSSYQVLQKTKNQLEAKKEQLETKKEQLEVTNKQISHSINAALTIQQAILPFENKLEKILMDYFVIYKPKDVVSGDFYWANTIFEGRTKVNILAVVDCTGHGIPGAFMTLIGNTLLDKIVNTLKISDPAKILEILHLEVRKVLKQKFNRNNYGMDMGIVAWEEQKDGNFKITFAGAKNHLYYFNPCSENIALLKGDRVAIGGQQNDDISFTNKEIILPLESSIYMATDGFEDQNNVKRRSFGRKRLVKHLQENIHQPLAIQRQNLANALDEHMVGTTQRDDILLVGFKIVNPESSNHVSNGVLHQKV